MLFAVWAFGALWFDAPIAPHGVAIGFAGVLLVLILLIRGAMARAFSWLLCSAVILGWWLTLEPKDKRNWQPDVAQTAWAGINGDEVTLHNVRRCDYRTASDYTPHWETRKVRLSQITGIDLAITYWGSPYMAHPIASFQFADAPPICFSIETRKQIGEKYSDIGGFFRQYELIYVVADESDVIRLRTNIREGEDVYLYRLQITPEKARERFMDYLTTLNALRDTPRWYNAATTNCTTSIRTQHHTAQRLPWDWRMLVNGKADEMMYERGAFETGGLSFPELRSAARVGTTAGSVGSLTEYSARIRERRPGFAPPRVPASPGS
jgi:hypothetical protein